jgi:hypothetical protein
VSYDYDQAALIDDAGTAHNYLRFLADYLSLVRCQWPSVSPHWRQRNSPLVAIVSPRWWPSDLPHWWRYSFMRDVLAGELGDELYRKRKQMIDLVFGHTKHNRGVTRFHRRGRAAVRTEWRLLMATHNLTKLHRHQIAAAGALNGPREGHSADHDGPASNAAPTARR